MTTRTLWRLLRYGRPHVPSLLAAFTAMAVLALMNGALAFLTGPAFQFLLTGGTRGLQGLARVWPSITQVPRDLLGWVLPGLIVAISGVKGLAYLAQFYFSGLFGQRLVADLRRDYFERISTASPLQLGGLRSGELISRFAADVTAVETAAVYTVASYTRDGLQVLVLLALVLHVSWKLTLVLLVLGPLTALPVMRLTRTVLRRTREAQARMGELAAQMREGLAGLRTVQVYGAFELERERFAEHAQHQRRALVRAAWARGAVPGLMEIIAAFTIASALTFAARGSWIGPEALISFLTALVLVYQPLKDLGRTTQFAQQAAVAGERLFSVLDLPAIFGEGRGPPAPRLTRELRFEDVHFSYGDRGALHGLSLSIPHGKTTALVGPSGAGKSTVTALLLRLARPTRGRILLDDHDLDSLEPGSVRRQLALVTQDALLFSSSIRDNLRYGRPEASDAEVEAAARHAQADAFIRALPRGYDTLLGERGAGLSGGQRQRLCLARALVSEAPIWVLDEATSHLDPESEREVQTALDATLGGRTALVVAHRLSTVVSADVIHVLEAGRVVQSGTHAQLLAAGGLYARLWQLQHQEAAVS